MLTLLTTSLLAFAPVSTLDLAPIANANANALHITAPQNPPRPGKDRVDPVRRGGPVPEPATILLVGSGALGAAFIARRRRKSASEQIVEES